MIEAEAQLNHGLDLLSRLPEGSERDQYEISLQVALGAAFTATKGFAAFEAEGLMNVPANCAGSRLIIPTFQQFCVACLCTTCIDQARLATTMLTGSCSAWRSSARTPPPAPSRIGGWRSARFTAATSSSQSLISSRQSPSMIKLSVPGSFRSLTSESPPLISSH